MKKEKITKDMTFGELIEKYPEAADTLLSYGLHCIGCHIATSETIEQGATAHGMNKKKIEEMIKKINNIIKKPK